MSSTGGGHQAGPEGGALERPGVRAADGRAAATARLPDHRRPAAGTTSLHRYLVQHPGVRTTLRTKGVHFFGTGYGGAGPWYASRFPTRLTACSVRPGATGSSSRTGEASPYYLFHPQSRPGWPSTCPRSS